MRILFFWNVLTMKALMATRNGPSNSLTDIMYLVPGYHAKLCLVYTNLHCWCLYVGSLRAYSAPTERYLMQQLPMIQWCRNAHNGTSTGRAPIWRLMVCHLSLPWATAVAGFPLKRFLQLNRSRPVATPQENQIYREK